MSDRLPAVLLLVGVVALAWAGMAWGWRRRAGRQATLAPPATGSCSDDQLRARRTPMAWPVPRSVLALSPFPKNRHGVANP